MRTLPDMTLPEKGRGRLRLSSRTVIAATALVVGAGLCVAPVAGASTSPQKMVYKPAFSSGPAMVAGSKTAVGLAAAAAAASAIPGDYYVSGTGNDANAGTTAGSPFKTMAKALSVVKTGQTISMLAGTYAPFVVSTPGVTVTAATSAHVKGVAHVRDVVLVAASNVTIKGLDVTGCIPDPNPYGGLDNGASTGVRIGPNTTGVTLTGLTVHDSHGTNSDGLPFGCYGIYLQNTTKDLVTGNNVYHNGYGISVSAGGQGIVISNNDVHDNDVIIKNTKANSVDDFGGVGIGFGSSNGVTASGNSVYNNDGPSHDWGTDGGGFEIYQSSNIAMTGNSIHDNVDILETGAGATGACNNNSFTGNTAYGRSYTKLALATGLILRCAANMNVSNNTIYATDWWTFWVYQRQSNGMNGGSIAGLSIQKNKIIQGYDQIYAIGLLPSAGVTINNNTYTYKGMFGSYNGTKLNIATWRKDTGFEAAYKG